MTENGHYAVYDVAGGVASPECRKLAELAAGKVVLEVGSQHGCSTVAMGQVARQVVAVDWHQGDEHAHKMNTLAGFWENLRRYGVLDRVVPVVGTFEAVAPLLTPGRFDLAFIDAQHHYEDTRRHVLLALPLLKPGGVIAVHDYGWPNFPGVKQAVDELVGGRPETVFETLAVFPAAAVRPPTAASDPDAPMTDPTPQSAGADYPDATRPRFVIYRPPGDASKSPARLEDCIPYRLARRGHECVVYSDQKPAAGGPLVVPLDPRHADWTLPGFWIVVNTLDPAVPLQAAGQTGVLHVAEAAPESIPDETWERHVSIWTAVAYNHFPGVVRSRLRDASWLHANHFTFGHLGEQESRAAWLDLSPGDVMLDVGSSLGSWTLPAAAMGAAVHAFDPGTDADQLDHHVGLNGFGDRVVLNRMLVSDRSGRLVRRAAIPWHSVGARPHPEPVLSVTLDDYVAGMGLDRVDFVKVDVDGSEAEVLAGARHVLDTFRPRVVVEVHDFLGVDGAEIAGLLAARGYETVAAPKEEGFYSHVYGRPRR